MNTLAANRIEIGWQSGDQGFTLAGTHFSNLVVMQNHAAD